MKKITFRGYNRFKFQSLKLGRSVFCNSQLLRDFLLDLEWDLKIRSYEIWPFKFIYQEEGRNKTFRPHLVFDTNENHRSAVWLKSIDPGSEETYSRTIRLITELCARQSLGFLVKSPAEVRRVPYFSNLKILQRYSRCEISIDQLFLCHDFFSQFPTPLLGDLAEFFAYRDQPPAVVFALLSQRIVAGDLDNFRLDYDFPIELINEFPNFENRGLMS